jgi:hypothetical protein
MLLGSGYKTMNKADTIFTVKEFAA